MEQQQNRNHKTTQSAAAAVSPHATVAFGSVPVQRRENLFTDELITSGASAEVPAFNARMMNQNVPVQRVKETEAVAQSASMGDLTDIQIAEINNEPDKQTKLDKLMGYSVITSLSGLPAFNEIEVKAVAAGPDYGQAFYDENGAPKYRIEIYDTAFNGGLPVVYSTLRHELIHIGQYFKELDTLANSNAGTKSTLVSDVAFEDSLDSASNIQGEKGPASEVETHAWEITNAPATGVDKSFIYERAVGLQNNWSKLKSSYVNKAKASRVNKWRNKLSPLVSEAKTKYGTLMDVPWPTHTSKNTYAEEKQEQGKKKAKTNP